MNNVTGALREVAKKTPSFLQNMRGGKPGFYRYSFSGDRYDAKTHWGLGNTVFAAKSWYALGQLPNLPEPERQAMQEFILSFRQTNGYIFDPLIRRLSLPARVLDAAVTLNPPKVLYTPTKRAETRQAIAALKLLGYHSPVPIPEILTTPAQITAYLDKLDWSAPWSAGSHFSHLLFFLANSPLPQRQHLIDAAKDYIMRLQHDDGTWYRGKPSLAQRINGAMKIITGLKAAGSTSIPHAEALIDTCLAATHDRDACDNFNIVYVLKHASQQAPNYRPEEIREFAVDRLSIYRQHYHSKSGGFSFRPGQASTHYYNARLTRGLNEPDIHATALFLWGLSIIEQIINPPGPHRFREHST